MSDPHDVPLGALPFEDFYSYFEARLARLADPSSSPKSPEKYLSTPSTSVPSLWHSDSSSSSRSSSLPPSLWTPDVSPSDIYPVPGNATPQQNTLSRPFAPLSADECSFLASIDPWTLEADILNVMANTSVPESVGHVPSPSRKRRHTNEEQESLNNASFDASSPHKRRRLSTGDHQSLSNIVPQAPSTNGYYYDNGINVTSDIMNDSYASAPPTSTYHGNATLSQAPYPSPHILHNVPVPSVPFPSAPSMNFTPHYVAEAQPGPSVSYGTAVNYAPEWDVNPDTPLYSSIMNDTPLLLNPTIPPVYLPEAQPSTSTYPGTGGDIDYTLEFNDSAKVDLYTEFGNSNVLSWDPSYLTLHNVANGPLDWNMGLPGPEDIYSTISLPAPTNYATSVSNVVAPSLDQQALSNGIVYNGHDNIVHTNAVANNAMHSGVDFCQHSETTHEISTTEHVANMTMPNAEVPSTSVAPSVETVPITIEYIELETPPHSPDQKNSKKPPKLPNKDLWYRDGKKFICRYNGPHRPEGCSQRSGTSRNLTRHMRMHARGELANKDLKPHQRVALNGIPEDQWRLLVRCPLAHADLHKCAFYRKRGGRWAAKTMERPENLVRKHESRNHK